MAAGTRGAGRGAQGQGDAGGLAAEGHGGQGRTRPWRLELVGRGARGQGGAGGVTADGAGRVRRRARTGARWSSAIVSLAPGHSRERRCRSDHLRLLGAPGGAARPQEVKSPAPAAAASSPPGLALVLAAAIPSSSGVLVHARLPLALELAAGKAPLGGARARARDRHPLHQSSCSRAWACPPRAPRRGEVQARLPLRRGQEEGDGGAADGGRARVGGAADGGRARVGGGLPRHELEVGAVGGVGDVVPHVLRALRRQRLPRHEVVGLRRQPLAGAAHVRRHVVDVGIGVGLLRGPR
ncbi:unnamed protein product [Miscanthus lutarioriparius]|uniref:Uncharacterized protein n=1 Tax=Miscanthus lutarioriparius TaxID=422564 RepID=A0A811MH22_9POAL|nr:unnamed protein product [Miscanthus lutarioriparius]